MLAKGRKVPGGGARGGGEAVAVAVAANYAFGALEVEESIIKHRLLTRTTTTRGDPPLRKLQKKFTSFFTEIHSNSNSNSNDNDNYSDCERLAKAFLQELSTFEIPLLKTRAVVHAHLREKDNFCDLHHDIDTQIARARSDIDALKSQLQESRIERRHKEDCEAVRKLIATQPPRSETQALISQLESEIAALEADNAASSRLLDLRKKQFALLLHVVDELQNTIEDEQKSLIEEMRLAAEDHKNALDDADAGMALD